MMRFKTGFGVGLGVGYVLGARAGRERYEQMRQWAAQVTGSPAVQHAAERTRSVASESARRGLTVVQHGVEKAGSAVRVRLHRNGGPTDELVERIEDQEGRSAEHSPRDVRQAFGTSG